tara:strand:- start:1510 stop:1863 length:354 start_codon:yes stop_codon:yes gene_type:complete
MSTLLVDLLAELRFFSALVSLVCSGMPLEVSVSLSERDHGLLAEVMSEIDSELCRRMLPDGDPGVFDRVGSLQVTAGKFFEVFSKIPRRTFLAFPVDKQERLIDALGEAHRLTRSTD